LFEKSVSVSDFINIKKKFKKKLEEYGLQIMGNLKYEVIGNKLVISFPDGKVVKIKDPEICRLARLYTREEVVENIIPTEALRERLLALCNIYGLKEVHGFKIDPRKIKRYSHKKLLKLIKIIEKEKEEDMKKLNEYLAIRVCRELISYGSDVNYYYGIEEDLLRYKNVQELYKILAKLTLEDINEKY